MSSSGNDRDTPNPHLLKDFGAAGRGIFSNATGTLGQGLMDLDLYLNIQKLERLSGLWLFVSGVLEGGILLY